MENDVLYNRIMNVVHEEYGSGSTAVANPTGEPTDSLETIQIGDDVYSIAGGGGGAMIITMSQDGDDTVLDKTYTEIKTAIESGIFPYLLTTLTPDVPRYVALVGFYGYNSGLYGVVFSKSVGDPLTFTSETEDGVLTLEQGE